MNRRELLGKAGCVAVATLAAWRETQGARTVPKLRESAPPSAPHPEASGARLPRTVAGIVLPDTKLAQGAFDLAHGAYPDYLLNHALRTYLFGALAGRAQKLQFDDEPLYLSCLLHDLGLTPQYEGDQPFEIQGAEAAKKFLTEQGTAREKIEMIWDGIAMHASAIGGFKRPEIMLVGHGAGADVLGPDPADIPPDKVAEVLTAFPRLKFKEQFVKSCADVVRRHPRGAGRSFMRDIGERYVADFHPRNICDLIDKAPFVE